MLEWKKGLAVLLASLTLLVSLPSPARAAQDLPPAPEDSAVAPASLFPLEERVLEPVNLSGSFPDALRSVPLSLLLGEAGEGLAGTERLAWRLLDSGSYETADAGASIDLSSLWTSAVSQADLEILIPGDPTDPLAVRYIVPIQAANPRTLLSITAWSAGKEIADGFSCVLWDDSPCPHFAGNANSTWKPEDGAVLKMEFSSAFQDLTGVEVRVYLGNYSAPEDIPTDADDITADIWGSDAPGYSGNFTDEICQFTLTAARDGQSILVMPFSLQLSPSSSVFIRCAGLLNPASGLSALCREDEDGGLILNQGLDPAAPYRLRLRATDLDAALPFDTPSLEVIDAAYVGRYMTKEDASGSEDIAPALFDGGYEADYSRGVAFTIFDKYGFRHFLRFQTLAYAPQAEEQPDGSGRDESFSVTGAEGDYEVYCAKPGDDSFYASGWQTVFLLNGDPGGRAVTAERIRPVFQTGQDVSVHSGHDPSGPVQISGSSDQPFLSGEPLPYLAVTGQGERRYHVTFVTQRAGGPSLFISGVTNSGARDEAGMFPLSPDMERTGFYDLLTANIGDAAMTGLRVSLNGAENVRLDDYWNFGAVRSLAAFTSAQPLTLSGLPPQYGALFNLTKIRLVKTGDGEPAGILTVSADGIEPVHIRLSGPLELPHITDEALPEGLQHAPYAHQLQMQAAGSWEDAVFTPAGPLPGGLELRPSGEICGTPKVHGTFSIPVKLSVGGVVCDEKTFSLEIAAAQEPTVPEEPPLPEEPSIPEEPTPPEEPPIPEEPAPPENPPIPEEPIPPERPAPPEFPLPPVIFYPSDDPPQQDSPSAPAEGENAHAPAEDGGGDVPPVSDTSSPPLADVSPEDWFYEDVCWAYQQKLMLGDPTLHFVPEEAVSQATIVTVLARMMDVDLSRYDGESSPSVAPGMWYTQAAIWAQRAGLLPDNQVFTGASPISRQQMAIMLSNYLTGMGVQSPDSGSVAFEDAAQMSEAGRSAFQSLYGHGIFKGVGGLRMDPEGTTTRAQFATLIHRISTFMQDYSLGK